MAHFKQKSFNFSHKLLFFHFLLFIQVLEQELKKKKDFMMEAAYKLGFA